MMKTTPAVHGILGHWRPSSVPILFLFIVCTIGFVFEYSNQPLGNLSQLFAGTKLHKNDVEGSWKMKPNSQSNHNEFPLICSLGNRTVRTCPSSYYPSKFGENNIAEATQQQQQQQSMIRSSSCPDYFRWIHEDLMPWRETGITLDMVERVAKTRDSFFRLVIVNGTAYVETYRKAYQTRDKFTLWGILQLLRRYPGQLPDLDLIFNTGDRPAILKECYPKKDSAAAPPLFAYDGDDSTFDIVFPDWSFWGWAELNIKPWESLMKEMKEGNEARRWVDREPHAHWKGTTKLAPWRMDLLKCNASEKHDWGARIYDQDWLGEERNGFQNSNLARQCNHRYKIYVEGKGWSVSEKYILACDSVTLMVKPRYYDFFTRALIPLQHYWPIRVDDKCGAIKYAVDWGNTHQEEAQGIGKAASDFVQEELQMKYVYDYMFHLLNEYGKLLKYKPSVPRKAVEVCSEALACPAEGLTKAYMMDSVVMGPLETPPCALPPPYDAAALHSVLEKKENSMLQVKTREKQYWDGTST